MPGPTRHPPFPSSSSSSFSSFSSSSSSSSYLLPRRDVSLLLRAAESMAAGRLSVYRPGASRSAVAIILRFPDKTHQHLLHDYLQRFHLRHRAYSQTAGFAETRSREDHDDNNINSDNNSSSDSSNSDDNRKYSGDPFFSPAALSGAFTLEADVAARDGGGGVVCDFLRELLEDGTLPPAGEGQSSNADTHSRSYNHGHHGGDDSSSDVNYNNIYNNNNNTDTHNNNNDSSGSSSSTRKNKPKSAINTPPPESSAAAAASSLSSPSSFSSPAPRAAPYQLEMLCVKRRDTDWAHRWAGEVCFPGGRRDPEEDANDYATVCRAAAEMLGIPLGRTPEFVCLGQLPDTPLRSRNFANAGGGGAGLGLGVGQAAAALLAGGAAFLNSGESSPLSLASSSSSSVSGGAAEAVQSRFVFLHVGELSPAVRHAGHEVERAHWVPLQALLALEHERAEEGGGGRGRNQHQNSSSSRNATNTRENSTNVSSKTSKSTSTSDEGTSGDTRVSRRLRGYARTTVAQPLSRFVHVVDADRRLLLAGLFPGALLLFPALFIPAGGSADASRGEGSTSTTTEEEEEAYDSDNGGGRANGNPNGTYGYNKSGWKLWGLTLRSASELMMLHGHRTLDWPLFTSDSLLCNWLVTYPFHGYYECCYHYYRLRHSAMQSDGWWLRWLQRRGRGEQTINDETQHQTRYDSPRNSDESGESGGAVSGGGGEEEEEDPMSNRTPQPKSTLSSTSTLSAAERAVFLLPHADPLLYAAPDTPTTVHVAAFLLLCGAWLLLLYAVAAAVYHACRVFRIVLRVDTAEADAAAEARLVYYKLHGPPSAERERREYRQRLRTAEEAEERRRGGSGSGDTDRGDGGKAGRWGWGRWWWWRTEKGDEQGLSGAPKIQSTRSDETEEKEAQEEGRSGDQTTREVAAKSTGEDEGKNTTNNNNKRRDNAEYGSYDTFVVSGGLERRRHRQEGLEKSATASIPSPDSHNASSSSTAVKPTEDGEKGRIEGSISNNISSPSSSSSLFHLPSSVGAWGGMPFASSPTKTTDTPVFAPDTSTVDASASHNINNNNNNNRETSASLHTVMSADATVSQHKSHDPNNNNNVEDAPTKETTAKHFYDETPSESIDDVVKRYV